MMTGISQPLMRASEPAAALARARKTLRHLDWFEVKEIRGTIGEAGVKEYQVVLEVGFRLEET